MRGKAAVAISLLITSAGIALADGRLGEAFCGADALFASMPTNGAVDVGRALAMLLQATENLNRYVAGERLNQFHREDKLLAFGLGSLQQATNFAPGAILTNVLQALGEFTAQLGALQMVGDTRSQLSAEPQLLRLNRALNGITSLFPRTNLAEAVELASRRSCPNHSTLIGHKGEKCWNCGAVLNRPVPLLPDRNGTVPQAIVAAIKSNAPLHQGTAQHVTLRLSTANTAPLTPAQLIRVHGQKIHLFLLDTSSGDYHHVHPQLGSKPGEYEFEFTPTQAGDYRLWVEAHVFPFAFREYAMADLPGIGSGDAPTVPREQTSFEANGLRYELVPEAAGLRTGTNSRLKLRVLRQDGSPFAQLEPIMEAYAHLVGFGEDRRSILHTHPTGAPVTDQSARGGPELEFQVLPPQAGYVRWFAQVKIAEKVRMVPFTTKVAPEETSLTAGIVP